MAEEYTIAILVFDQADLLDITGPKEVFGAVRQPVESKEKDPILQIYSSVPLIHVDYVGIGSSPKITTNDGTTLMVDRHLDEILSTERPYDVIVIPGGKGVHDIKTNEKIQRWVGSQVGAHHLLISVCTGAYVLAEAGLLTGMKVTTHQRHHDLFEQLYPKIMIDRQAIYCEMENIITTAGVTSGIDGAIRVVERLFGETQAKQVSTILNYSVRQYS